PVKPKVGLLLTFAPSGSARWADRFAGYPLRHLALRDPAGNPAPYPAKRRYGLPWRGGLRTAASLRPARYKAAPPPGCAERRGWEYAAPGPKSCAGQRPAPAACR